MESANFHNWLIIIILLNLGWNSLQFQNYLCSNSQNKRYFYYAGTEPVSYSLHIDFLFFNFEQSPLIPRITRWHSQFHRPKPPWLNILAWRNINKIFICIILQIVTTTTQFLTLYPVVSNDPYPFTACSQLLISIFHTEITFCSIRMNLEPLLLENIDIPHHSYIHAYPFCKHCKIQSTLRSYTYFHRRIYKPPWISSHSELNGDGYLAQEELYARYELRDKYASNELDINDFTSPEDANLLTQTYHE